VPALHPVAAPAGEAGQTARHAARLPVTADQAVATAMRWGKEDRGVVRAAAGAGLPGAEDIPLDEDEEEGKKGRGAPQGGCAA